MTQFVFRDQLLWSDGVAAKTAVEDILLDAIPGATGVRRASALEDRLGVDWWVDRITGVALAIDLKARKKDFGKDDLALEVYSVTNETERKTGWTLDAKKRADYILWWWADTGRWCLVPFPMLLTVFRENFGEWMEAYPEWTQDTEGKWKSSCIFVPRQVVWRAIYQRFGGQKAA